LPRRSRVAGGDADIAAVAALFAEPARSRIVLALLDGRALPASRLADEAGIAPSTASSHLAVLLDGGAVAVEQEGRRRYYRLAGPEVAAVVEQLGSLARIAPVRSLRDGTRAQALRRARTCYDHLAGQLGVALLGALIGRGHIVGHDGSFRPGIDRRASRGNDAPYRLTESGRSWLSQLGIILPDRGAGPELGHCVDWTEQRHHLSGRVGKALKERLFQLGWIEPGPISRSVVVTGKGRDALDEELGINPFGKPATPRAESHCM
jgi:DNA-binding transcriptional ArsR family regulator